MVTPAELVTSSVFSDVGSLDVFVKGESEVLQDLQPVFNKNGNHGDVWHRGDFFIDDRTEPYQVNELSSTGSRSRIFRLQSPPDTLEVSDLSTNFIPHQYHSHDHTEDYKANCFFFVNACPDSKKIIV